MHRRIDPPPPLVSGFLHIFHFKIPYFSRLKFPHLSVDFQTIFNKGFIKHYFQLYIWYIVVIYKYFNFLRVFFHWFSRSDNTHSPLNKKYRLLHAHKKFFVPSRNYSHVHGNVLHAISSFIKHISFVHHCHLTMNKMFACMHMNYQRSTCSKLCFSNNSTSNIKAWCPIQHIVVCGGGETMTWNKWANSIKFAKFKGL